jgi:hypothetical protein
LSWVLFAPTAKSCTKASFRSKWSWSCSVTLIASWHRGLKTLHLWKQREGIRLVAAIACPS